ncbi:5-methylcytosine rRNA methyltransferase NSUN4 isoform X2 [Ceratina calcarata]|nr:5-methylcytosine rRNA methyltransferase NSUN4 isoform X2 [Ceratina calcarata]
MYDVQKENIEFFKKKREAKMNNSQEESAATPEDQLVEIKKMYPSSYPNLLQAIKTDDEPVKHEGRIPVPLQSIDKDLNEISLDMNRIIDPTVNLSILHEYVPATKIKGLEDWALESDHYKFYIKADDFQINVEKEDVLPFPKHLHAYTFERENNTRFPSPKHGSTGVLDYYLFDGASILPVLALDIQLGDRVLDMCAAPGGKALAILQTLMPHILVANDIQESRVNRIKKVISQYVSDVYKTEDLFIVTERDARWIDETDTYNKILVDVPCTTDRHILHAEDNNIFKPSRIKERLRLPEIQSDILANALKIVALGGTVVYATCSLSPVQNDGVVQVALKKAWQENNAVMVVKDMTEALLPLQTIYEFAAGRMKYGHIVIPSLKNNWGPMYFCKIVKLE